MDDRLTACNHERASWRSQTIPYPRQAQILRAQGDYAPLHSHTGAPMHKCTVALSHRRAGAQARKCAVAPSSMHTLP